MAVKMIRGGGSIKARRPQAVGPRDDALMGLRLPESKSIPSDSLQDYSILLFGRKKIGKTSLAAQFEDALFLMCEPGGKALRIRQVQVRSWPELKRYVDLAIEDKETRTIVVDTADFAYEYCMDYVCDKMAMGHPSDEAYGKGWKAVRKEFTEVIGKILHSGKGVVFISHSRDDEFKTRHSESYHKTVSSMPGQAKDVLEGLVDIWANYDYDGQRRVLIIGGSEEVDAGHRLEERFKNADGSPVNRIDMGDNPAEGYRNFVSAFNNRPVAASRPHGQSVKRKLTIKR
jgi:hypothetical protein